MENQSIIDKIKELIAPLLEQEGVELVELRYSQDGRDMVLKLLVDKPSGIKLNECASLNEKIGALLDKDDTITMSYILEVSSPGLDRPLVTKRDFERSIGKKVEVFLKSPLDNKHCYTGTINAVKEGSIIVSEGDRFIDIPFEIIDKGKLRIEFSR